MAVKGSYKTGTYVPLRYRKYHSPVIFMEGYFYPKYVAVRNEYIMPAGLAKLISNKLKYLEGKRITPEDLLLGKYKTYVVYMDDDRTVFSITDRYGNMISLITMPNTVYKYFSRKKAFI